MIRRIRTGRSRVASLLGCQSREVELCLVKKSGGPSAELTSSLQLHRLQFRTLVILGSEEVDRDLIWKKRGTAIGDRYPDTVQYVIAVGLEKDLCTVRRNPRQKTADLRLAGWVQVGLRILHEEHPASRSAERRDDDR